MTKEQKLALDKISSKLDPEEGKRRYCSFTKEERMDATEHLLYDNDTYLEDFLEKNKPCPIVSHEEMQRILSEPIKEDTKERRAINMIKKGIVKEREWNTLADIFQRAVKRNKLTKEQILQQCKEILKKVEEEEE